MTTMKKAAKQTSSRACKTKAIRKVNPAVLRTRRWIAVYSTSRHINAYKLDHNPRHIAEAWLDFRRFKKLKPDETVLCWIDCLADAVLNPPAANVRPPADTARNLDIWREVQVLRDKMGIKMTTATYGKIGQPYGLSASAVKMIVFRIQTAIDDPYYAPRAFHK